MLIGGCLILLSHRLTELVVIVNRVYGGEYGRHGPIESVNFDYCYVSI